MGLAERLRTSMKGALRKADEPFWHTDFLPTGVFPLDFALGGGFGYGRIAEIFGNWSSGKTMVLYHALIKNIEMGGISILCESEGAFNSDFFAALGGDPSKLYVVAIDTVEEFFDFVVTVCKDREKEKSETAIAIGWDSIAATGTKHLMDVGMDKRDMSKAGAMSFGTQLITTMVKKHKIAVIATNQVREAIGNQDSATHTPGGKAWPFHASQRLELRFDGGSKTSIIYDKSGGMEVGRMIRGQVVKNKLASPFGKFMLPIYVKDGYWHPEGYPWGTKLGIDKIHALFENYCNGFITYKTQKVITGTSGWYVLHPEIAPGRASFQTRQWPEVLAEFPQLKGKLGDLKNSSFGSTEGERPSDSAGDESGGDGSPGDGSDEASVGQEAE